MKLLEIAFGNPTVSRLIKNGGVDGVPQALITGRFGRAYMF